MGRQGLMSEQKVLWRVTRSPGPDVAWCLGYRGHRIVERQRAHGERQCALGHHTASGHRCGALIALASTRSERALWPSPGGQR